MSKRAFRSTYTPSTLLAFFIFLSFCIPGLAQALVNINTASLEELEALPGIGEVYAERIVELRPFATIEEIMNVRGIGEVTFLKIRDSITLGRSGGSSSVANSGGEDSSSSAHYSATPVSTKDTEEGKVELSAGRDRVGVVGSPLEFRAETSGGVQSRDLEWNFGDGTRGAGSLISHTYEYPGDYVVVLHTSLASGDAVARMSVKIVDPELSVTYAGRDRVEVSNGSAHEANLFGRALVTSEGVFVFLKDTIIKAGQSISFSSKATGLNPMGESEVSLAVLGEDMGQANIARKVEEHKVARINALQSEILAVERRRLALSQAWQARQVADVEEELETTLEETSTEETRPSDRDGQAREGVDEAQSALVLDAVEEQSAELGWWGVIKRFFLGSKEDKS